MRLIATNCMMSFHRNLVGKMLRFEFHFSTEYLQRGNQKVNHSNVKETLLKDTRVKMKGIIICQNYH